MANTKLPAHDVRFDDETNRRGDRIYKPAAGHDAVPRGDRLVLESAFEKMQESLDEAGKKQLGDMPQKVVDGASAVSEGREKTGLTR